jgi:hypothetical protein
MVTRWLALVYYRKLRKICHERPELRRHRRKCGRCRIKFLTGPGNRNHKYIGCSFGCRKEREREKSNERGSRYYQTSKGQKQKKARNRKRSLGQKPKNENPPPPIVSKSPRSIFHPEILRYITFLLLLASGQKPGLREVEEFLQQVLSVVMEIPRSAILRQRSLPERGG